MVQGLNQKQVETLLALQALNNASFQGRQCYNAPPMKEDSFNGKTLLTIAGLAGAVIFRKQIGGFLKKFFGNTGLGLKMGLADDWKAYKNAHKDGFIIKSAEWIKGAWNNLKGKVANLAKPAVK